jgi:type III pantothenate kinase
MHASADRYPLIAVDIGNSRLKFGLFTSPPGQQFPTPQQVLDLPTSGSVFDPLADWLGSQRANHFRWWIGSVNRPAAGRLIDWLREREVADGITLLCADDLPLRVALPRPDMVGIDRLLAAVGANDQRPSDRAAVIVDLGTAIKVDLVAADGSFQGGAILPGIGTSARALHEFTDLLPLLSMQELSGPPAAVGTNTHDAMRSGLFWGAVGAVRELIRLYTEQSGHEPAVFLTGGAAASVTKLLTSTTHYEPNLVLGGIVLSAGSNTP